MMRGVGAPRHHHGRHGGGGLTCRGLIPWFVAFHLLASFYIFNYLSPQTSTLEHEGHAVGGCATRIQLRPAA